MNPRIFALMIVLAACAGCIYRPIGLASSTCPLKDGTFEDLGYTEGSASALMIWFVPFSPTEMVTTARDEAIRAAAVRTGGPVDGMIDVSISANHLTLPFVTFTRSVVRGRAARLHPRYANEEFRRILGVLPEQLAAPSDTEVPAQH